MLAHQVHDRIYVGDIRNIGAFTQLPIMYPGSFINGTKKSIAHNNLVYRLQILCEDHYTRGPTKVVGDKTVIVYLHACCQTTANTVSIKHTHSNNTTT